MGCYYRVRQVLQSVTLLSKSASGITKCHKLYYKERQVLQSVAIITKWGVTQGMLVRRGFILKPTKNHRFF